jgi:hypothetical protein
MFNTSGGFVQLVHKGFGFEMYIGDGNKLSLLMYSDDIVLLASNEHMNMSCKIS